MPIEVVFLPDGSSRPLVAWVEDEARDMYGRYLFHNNWIQNVLARAEQSLLSNTFPLPFSVYLCLRGDHLCDRFDFDLVKQILAEARKHSWGQRIYLVADRQIGLSPIKNGYGAALSNWLTRSYEAGATDILEIGFSGYGNTNFDPIDTNLLRISTALSSERLKTVYSLRSKGPWKCFLGDMDAKLFNFLDGYVVYPSNSGYEESLLIVVNKDRDDAQMAVVEKARKLFPLAKIAILLYGPRIEAKPQLQSLCSQTKWQRPIKCRGPFELHFLLQSLNEDFSIKKGEFVGRIEKIHLNSSPIFVQQPTSLDPSLLITSSFNPQSENVHCREASHDAGRITYRLAPHSRYFVHPALDGAVLPEVLSQTDNITAWVYFRPRESERWSPGCLRRI